MRKTINKALLSIAIVATALFATTFALTSCKNDGKKAFINYIKPIDEALLGVVESYSAGLVSEGDPIRVSFNPNTELKLKYGESLPSGLFKFEPSLKGQPIWINENTIGYEYSGAQCGKQYIATVDLSKIINYDNSMEFGFGFRGQEYNLVNVEPIYTDEDNAAFDVKMQFVNAISEDDAMKLFDADFAKKHNVKASAVSNKIMIFHIENMTRTSERYTERVNINGSKIGSVDKVLPLDVAKKGVFSIASWYQDPKNNSIEVYFTRQLNPNQNLMGYLTTSPVKSFKTEIKDNKLTVYFDQSDNDSYGDQNVDLSILNGIKDIKGNSLSQGGTISVSTVDNKPAVRWSDESVIIPSVKNTEIYFDAKCLEGVTVRIIRVFDDNILSFVQQNDLDDTWGIQHVGRLERKIHLAIDNPDPTMWKTFPIRLSDYVDVKPGSMYQIEIDFGPEDYAFATEEAKKLHKELVNEDDYWDNKSYDYKAYYYGDSWNDPNGLTFYNSVSKTRNVFVSDVALTVKMGDSNDFDAFAFSISEGEPISSAEVTAYNYQMQKIASGSTNSEGYIHLSCPNNPYFVVASDKSKGKAIVVTKNYKSLSYSKFDVGGESIEKGIKGFIYSNRGVWRPGDELQLNLMLSGDTELPENYPVVLDVFDASGQKYTSKLCENHKGGIYSFNVQTSPNDITGQWRATFKVGNATLTKYLRVETVKPNRLEMTFDLPKYISTTQETSTELTAKWLNGMATSGLKATIDARLTEGKTEFADFKDYMFVNETDDFYPEEVEIFSDKMNQNGKADIKFSPLKNYQSNTMLNAAFTVKVFEAGGDFSVATFYSKVSSFSRYVGVNLPETQSRWGSYYFTNKDYKFDVVLVGENGKQTTGTTNIEYALYKLDSYWWWSSEDSYTLRRYATGTYKSAEQKATLMCNNGKATINVNIPSEKWGNYLLVVRDVDGGNTFAKVISFDDDGESIHSAAGSKDAPTLLMLRTSADTYKVGDNITAMFPANDKAKAIVTVETADKVLQHIYLDKLGSDAKVDIKATKEMIPNVYIYVSLIQPNNAGNDMPVRMYGVVPVKVEDKEMRLNPVINAPEMANTKKTIQVKVSEEKKRPMTYTLAVVDEGILGLTNFKTPAPYEYFNSKQALGVRTWDNYSSIASVFTGELGSVYAIGGDDMINLDQILDNRFKAFAATYGPFELKKGETNSHDIEIPKSSGALRVMVVAKGNEKSYGSSEKRITVQDPIMLYTSAPRVVAPGDVAMMNIEVLAPKMQGKTLPVKIEAENLTPQSAWPTTVKIDENGSGLVAIPAMVKNQSGVASIKVSVTGDGYTAESETKMPIRLPNTEKRVTYPAEMEGGKTATVNFDLNCIEGSQSARVMLSSAIPVDIYSRLDYLTSYPHGCLEQIVSAAFPQLYLNYFITQDEESMAKSKESVNTTIAAIKSYLKSDNSLSVWPGSEYVSPWIEIYALHFLAEAKNQGFEVPDYIFNNVVKHQAATANAWNMNPDFPQGEVIQAYRLFALAVAGNPEKSAMNRFKDLKMRHYLTKILAAAAFAKTGKTTIAEKLVQDVGTESKEDYYMAPYSSPVRDMAIVLYTKILLNDSSVDEIMRQLCDEINNNSWLSTQTTSFALFSLGKYAEKKDVANAPISAVVVVNGEEHIVNANTVSAGFSFVPKNGKNTIEIRNNAVEKLVARIFTKAAVMEYETKESGNNLAVTVKYVDKNGKAINPASLEAGTDFRVLMNVKNTTNHYLDNLALSYYLPSGWEIVNDRMNETSASSRHVDIRDDRAYYYFELYSGENKTFQLKLNSTFVGTFVIPAIHCEDMYDDQTYYIVPSQKVTVK